MICSYINDPLMGDGVEVNKFFFILFDTCMQTAKWQNPNKIGN